MDDGGRPDSEATDESILRLAKHLVRGQDAQDLAQEIRLWALQKRTVPDRLQWLGIVARRTLWRWNLRDQARSRRERMVARPEAQESPLAEVETASLREYLEASVMALREPYRVVVRLHYLEELSIAEIGRLLGRPSATVRVQLKRGLAALRDRLERRKRRFLLGVPLLPRRLRGRSRGERWIAGGAVIAVGLAAVLLVVLRGQVERGVEAKELLGVASLPAAAVDSATRPLPDRVPLLAGEAASPELAAAPVLLAGRVLTSDGRPIAGAPVFARREGKSRLVAVSDAEGRYEVASANLRDWIEARPEGHLPSPRHLVCSVERGRRLDLVSARPSGRIRGRVWDAEEKPVPGAEVSLEVPLLTSVADSLLAVTVQDEVSVRPSFGDQATIEGALEPTVALTDASGRFEAPKPPGKRLVVLARADGLPAGLEVLQFREGEDEDVEIHLPAPASIDGRVLDPDGRPCAGARLELVFPDPLPRSEARTDESGRYRFDGLASFPFVLRLVERPSGAASFHGTGRLAAGEHRTLDLSLSDASSISGTVEDGGRPLEGWTVVLREIAGDTVPVTDSRETRTASDGRFAFLGCSPQEYDLECFDPDAPERRGRATVKAGSPSILHPVESDLVALRGRIRMRGDAPRPILLSFTALPERSSARGEMIALDPAQDGFSGPSLPRGAYLVDGFSPGFHWRKSVELDGRDLFLEIPARGSLRVEVELPAGASFEDASAFVRMRAPLESNWIHAAMPRVPRQPAFQMELMPGTYWVIVLVEGYAAEYFKVKVEEGREERATVAPKKGTPARIQVVAPRALGSAESLRLEIEEEGRTILVPFPRRDPGASSTWWAGVDLTADARRILARTSEGLKGELLLTEERLRSGDLRIDLE